MTRAALIRAGGQFFYTHPRSGALVVGASVEPSLFIGHDGIPSSRISPVMRFPATQQLPVLTSLAVAPVSLSSAIGIGSHLWVG